MNTITLAELYKQQYPIILTSTGESRFLQESNDGLGFNLEDDNGHIKASHLRKDYEYPITSQGMITIRYKTYRILTDQKNQPSPKLTRNIVTAYLSKPNDESDLTPDDRIQIFKTILAGSSDVTLDLFKDVCSEYDVDFNQLNKNNDYDFYRFTSLVKDILLEPNNLWVPYDTQHEIILKYYGDFNYSEGVEDPYEEQVSFIKNNEKLFSALYEANEGTIPEMPKKSIEQEKVKFVTKTITWQGLGHVCDFLLDHNETKFTLDELKTSSNENLDFEVLPDNRVIMKGQVYTPMVLTTAEVYSL